MLAHNQGTAINASNLASSLGVASVTISRYIDLLHDLLLIRKLPPFTFNVKKRLVKSPRVYVRDSGITHALLNIESYNSLLGHPVVGKSWEGFVIENIMAVLPRRVQAYYYRTAHGPEIDLVLEFSPQERWAIEIKRSSAPSQPKGFHAACEDIEATKRFIIYTGTDTFSMPGQTPALPLQAFLTVLLQ